MMIPKRVKISLVAVTIVLIAALYTYAVFFSALHQPENHQAIFRALPRVILHSDVVRLDDKTYIAKNLSDFVAEMAKQGFTEHDQLGSGHFFSKNGKRYFSESRMYTSYFILYDSPKEY